MIAWDHKLWIVVILPSAARTSPTSALCCLDFLLASSNLLCDYDIVDLTQACQLIALRQKKQPALIFMT